MIPDPGPSSAKTPRCLFKKPAVPQGKRNRGRGIGLIRVGLFNINDTYSPRIFWMIWILKDGNCQGCTGDNRKRGEWQKSSSWSHFFKFVNIVYQKWTTSVTHLCNYARCHTCIFVARP